MRKYFTFLIMFIFCLTNVKAASVCDLTDQAKLREKANNVKVSSEVVENTIIENSNEWPVEMFQINILNITPELYVKVTNNIDESVKTLTYNDAKDGVISFDWEDMFEITKFKIEIYSSDKTSCPNELYKTTYINIPRFNEYSEMEMCKENSDLSLCQKYVTWEELSENEFFNKLDKEIKKKEQQNNLEEETPEKPVSKNPVLTFLNNYKWIIIGGAVILVGTYVGYVIIKKRKKHKDAINNGGSKI